MAVSSLVRPNFELKCVELIMAGVSIGVVIDLFPLADSPSKMATVLGTQIGFIMLSLVLVLSFLFDSPMHMTILVLTGLAGVGMWTATGGLIVHAYQQSSFTILGIQIKPDDRHLASGIAALVNALVHLIDVLLTFKK